jgi:adenosylmethionine-8-amino-7-oxononanoate aminotransferase
VSDQTSPDELRRWDREHYWHAFSQMSEYDGLIVESAEGCWLNAVDGRRILDGAGSLWCNVFGHRHPKINQAVIEQLSQVAHVTSLGMSHPTTIRLAKRLADIAPPGLRHVFFSSDGASAVEVAMKQAFQYWRQCRKPEPNRQLFVAVGDAYHGDTIGTSSVGGVALFRDPFKPLLFPVIHGPCPIGGSKECHNAPTVESYLAEYEKILAEHASEIVAVIVEPMVQAAAGVIVHPPGFLRGLRELTKKYNTLLIADEVAVGIGRTGKMFACEHENVAPDFLCLGKGLTGGYLPMSATLSTDRIWEAFLGTHEESKTFYYGHTYGGNPLAAAAAQATLDIFESENILAEIHRKSELLSKLLQPLSEHRNVGAVRQLGFVAAVELVADRHAGTSYPGYERRGREVCRFALDRHVWLRPLGDVIPIVPAFSIRDEELGLLVAALRFGIDAAAKTGDAQSE